MTGTDYLHGFSTDEQRRLVEQAEYWCERLIPHGLAYEPGDRVLELGCGAGAALAVLGETFRDVSLAGIDLEPRQIEFARRHLAARGFSGADVRVGDAARLPWEDGSVDRVFVMWFLEHLADPLPVLREAHRVLRPGGTISLTETDYTSFRVVPPSEDFDALARAQRQHYALHGAVDIGRRLGPLLVAAGFDDVRNGPVGFHFFAGDGSDELRRYTEYTVAHLELGVPAMVRALGVDEEPLRRGLELLRRLPDDPRGSMTQIVYRAHARVASLTG